MQLVAYGAQDVYLTGSPQITFFKLVYRRHTNFAIESIEQVFHGTPSWGQKATVTVSRNGDLVTDMFLQITLPAVNARATRNDDLYDDELAATVAGPWDSIDFNLDENDQFLDADNQLIIDETDNLPYVLGDISDAISDDTTTLAELRAIVPGLTLSVTRDHATKLIRGPFDPTLFRHKYDATTDKHVLVQADGVTYVVDQETNNVTLDPDSAFVTACEDSNTTLFDILYNPDFAGVVYTAPRHSYQYANSLGHHLVEACEIEIGGQRVDKHYGEYYEVWDELRTPETKRAGYGRMVGKQYHPTTGAVWDRNVDVSDLSKRPQLDADMGHTGPVTLYVPLRFWFNGNAGLALPLIALQYHEVKLQFSLAAFDTRRVYRSRLPPAYTYGTVTSAPVDPLVALWVDYVYLDTDERRRFAQASHEYLIEQVQFTGSESVELRPNAETTHKVRLNFNHPTKELIWCVRSMNHAETAALPFNFGESTVDERLSTDSETFYGYEYVRGAKILLNGHDRIAERDGTYFRLVMPYMAHTCVPKRHVYCYAFALRPEDHQCSGSLNMSRIDNAAIHLRFAPSSVPERDPDTGEIVVDAETQQKQFVKEAVRLNVYAVSYNILRIVSGMGGLAYSN